MAFGDLTTLADVKTWLQTSQSAFPPTDDALLSRLITAASQYVQTWLNRQIAQCDYIEVRDGTGGQRLQFARFPVCAVQSLTIDGIAIPPAPPSVPSTVLTAGYVFSPTQLAIRGYYFHAPGSECRNHLLGGLCGNSARYRSGMHRAGRAAIS